MQYYISSAPHYNINMIQGLDKVQPINGKYILTIHNYFDLQGFPFGLETWATSGTPSIHCSLPYFVQPLEILILTNRFFGSSSCRLHQAASLTCWVLWSLDMFDLGFQIMILSKIKLLQFLMRVFLRLSLQSGDLGQQTQARALIEKPPWASEDKTRNFFWPIYSPL